VTGAGVVYLVIGGVLGALDVMRAEVRTAPASTRALAWLLWVCAWPSLGFSKVCRVLVEGPDDA
jgi:hypothetical protein